MKKSDDYTAKIILCLSELFNEDGDFFIDPDEFKEGNNLTEFVHALSNLSPAYFYAKLTGEKKSILEFNHIANHLIYQNKDK